MPREFRKPDGRSTRSTSPRWSLGGARRSKSSSMRPPPRQSGLPCPCTKRAPRWERPVSKWHGQCAFLRRPAAPFAGRSPRQNGVAVVVGQRCPRGGARPVAVTPPPSRPLEGVRRPRSPWPLTTEDAVEKLKRNRSWDNAPTMANTEIRVEVRGGVQEFKGAVLVVAARCTRHTHEVHREEHAVTTHDGHPEVGHAQLRVHMRPNILGNQCYTPASRPKMADMPITMWKCATTK